MYFTNINDNELSQYHNEVNNNFSMALTTVLSSPLFKIETIISNSIYKIYPLFYCEGISSTNNEDRIIENKCIICTKNTNTRLYFNTPTPIPITVDDIGFTSSLIQVDAGQFNILKLGSPLFVFYSKKDRRLLENVKIVASLISTTLNSYYDEGCSNKDGLVYLSQLMESDNGEFFKGSIVIEYNGVTKTLWERG